MTEILVEVDGGRLIADGRAKFLAEDGNRIESYFTNGVPERGERQLTEAELDELNMPLLRLSRKYAPARKD